MKGPKPMPSVQRKRIVRDMQRIHQVDPDQVFEMEMPDGKILRQTGRELQQLADATLEFENANSDRQRIEALKKMGLL